MEPTTCTRRGEGAAPARTVSERNELALAHDRLAYGIARRLWRGTRLVRRLGQLADAEQEAWLGLLRAAQRHDPARGPFAPLARKVIRDGLFEAACENGAPVRVPHAAALLGLKGPRERRGPRGTRPTPPEAVGRALGAPLPLPERFDPPMTRPAPWAGPGPLPLESLPPEERDLLERHYGLNGRPRQTLKAIGAAEGVSRQAVHQRLRLALARLRRQALRQLAVG